MDENRYVFRFYNVFQNPDNKNQFSFNSPYVSKKDAPIALYTELGETQYENNDAKPDRDTLIRDDTGYALPQSDVPPEDRGKRRDGIYLPHKGLSVIGLNDPKYSLYPFDMIDYNLVGNESETSSLPRFARYRFDNLPTSIKEMYRNTFNNIMREKYRFKYGLDDVFDENGKFVNPVGYNELPEYVKLVAKDTDRAMRYADAVPGANGANLVHSKYGMPMITEGFDWVRLLNSISDTGYGSDANALVLAQLPESALYTVNDFAKGNIAANTDFPEELLARYITPVSIKGTGVYRNSVEHRDVEPENSGVLDGINNLIWERREDGNRNKFHRQYWEDKARSFIEDNFNIDSNKVVSDEIKKYIYKDLSSWYNKNNRSSNILKGIRELGQ